MSRTDAQNGVEIIFNVKRRFRAYVKSHVKFLYGVKLKLYIHH